SGLAGLVLNAAVLFLLWTKKIRSGWSTYRVGISFTALQGLCISLLAVISCQVHLFNSQNYVLIFYGPIAYLPQIYNDIAMFLNLVLVIGVWEFVPATCLMQYLALCKPDFSNRKRLSISYLLSILLLLSSLPHYTVFHNPASQRPYFEDIARRVHELADDDVFVVYAVTLFGTPQNEKAVINLAAFVVVPSFNIAFLVFCWCCAKISRALSAFGVKLSARTAAMQRTFLKMLLLQWVDMPFAQCLLPLAVLSVPVGMFVWSLISGLAMDKRTLVISFSVWAVPIVQGAVALVYVNGMAVASSKNGQDPSMRTRMSTVV
ncbi:hypothetical protein PENTCL1PPCAC_14381, partial [Pristionchus entomophagus]